MTYKQYQERSKEGLVNSLMNNSREKRDREYQKILEDLKSETRYKSNNIRISGQKIMEGINDSFVRYSDFD